MASLDEPIRSAEWRPAAYVILGADGEYLYKGACRDLKERLIDHFQGKSPRTKNRRPLSLVYFKYFGTYEEALKHERYLKSGHGRAWLKRNIINDN